MKKVSLATCIFLFVLYIIFGNDLCDCLGVNQNTDILRKYTYMFAHGTWFHLLINMYSLLIIYFMAGGNWWQSIFALSVSVLIPDFVLPDDKMLVGMSTFIYCMTGILTMNSKNFVNYIIINISIIAIAFAIPSSNIAGIAHLYCYLMGLWFGIFTAKING